MKHTQEIPTANIADAVFKQFGPPFLGNGSNIVLNDRAVAVLCSTIHMI